MISPEHSWNSSHFLAFSPTTCYSQKNHSHDSVPPFPLFIIVLQEAAELARRVLNEQRKVLCSFDQHGVFVSGQRGQNLELLLMKEILHHLGCIKPCKKWDIYHINSLAGFLPSTVSPLNRNWGECGLPGGPIGIIPPALVISFVAYLTPRILAKKSMEI